MGRAQRTRGATMVEFVIVAPLAMLFVLGLIQVGFLYIAKSTLGHATFMAARHGAVHGADKGEIKAVLARGLIPFHQDSTEKDDVKRVGTAFAKSKADALAFLSVERLSPSAAAFKDFGIKDASGKTVIPNDNLEWRASTVGATSGVHIQDANLLRIRATYGYELKVPLMAFMLRRVMCGGSGGVQAFGGDVSLLDAVYSPASAECLKYYLLGRVPIVAHATVQMQTPARQ
jgi:hypothetical protein